MVATKIITCALLLILTTGLAVEGSRVSRVGNAIRSSSSGVDVAGATFLINDIVLAEGVLYAFRAYFRSDKPIHFQIWRPQSDGTATRLFQLISDTRIIPSLVNEVEDIYLVSKLMDCTIVQQGDRLGLWFEEAPGAVAYTFDDSDPTAYGMTMDPSVPLDIDNVLEFDALIFPYDFSVAAYVDTELNRYDNPDGDHVVSCPVDLLIPDVDIVNVIVPEPAEAGAPGATGATGPAGPQGATGEQGLAGEDGAIGSTGATGPEGQVGATGVMGPMGATGPSGIDGLVGATGPQGERGEQGPPGPPGPSFEQGINTDAVSSEDSVLGGMMDYILLAWLGLLTLTLIIFIIVCVVVAKRRVQPAGVSKVIGRLPSILAEDWMAKHKRRSSVGGPMLWHMPPGGEVSNQSADSMERGAVVSGIEGEDSWMGTLKSTTETCYSNETLNTVGQSNCGSVNGSDAVSVTISDSPMIS